MDSTGTPWSSQVAPTIFPRVGYSIISFLMFITTVLTVFNNGLVNHPWDEHVHGVAAETGFFRQTVITRPLLNTVRTVVMNMRKEMMLGVSLLLGLVSLCTLTLLAYERYNAVCKPDASLKLGMRRSIKGLLFVWAFCLFWAVGPLLGWSGYGPEGVQTSCSLSWEERSWSNYSYLTLYTLMCFLFPVAVIIYCYSRVLASMRKLNRSVELQSGRSLQKENDHATSMVLTMVVAFFMCWLPYTALSVVVVVNPQLHIPPLVATMPMYFAKTSPVYNPIIYFLSNKQFRDGALEMLSCGRYIPHGSSTRVSINMRPLSRRRRLIPCSRINRHSKVLPL
ncbi:pinopsin-like [Entelurus aequoreus]|uniref:pinopsin-like n=1 Tax=Entelurus aequoreus TaxID=161455 RepID=UPI002B1D50F7|nr:pinopsin-like [Entelurus aequoreus]